jgi:hypothetical protein
LTTPPTLTDEVAVAIDRLVEQKPHLFNLAEESGGKGSMQYRVLDRQAYYQGVIENLKAAGLCADYDYDLGENIQVKDSNDRSEEVAIFISTGFVRRGRSSYIQTCTPAAFPIPPGPNTPPRGSGCGLPYPPEISQLRFYIHIKGTIPWTLDTTPIVGPDPPFCASIGFPDRFHCPVRGPQDPTRRACELWRVGIAADTGQPGITFTRNGEYCTGPASGCERHPDNPFFLLDYEGGNSRACTESGICADLLVQH